MTRLTKPNSPTPFNINGAAHEIGCAPNTLREYIKSGQLDVQRTPAGHAILYAEHIEQARELFRRNTRRAG
jgi:predicted site-specific integrase-resolvase